MGLPDQIENTIDPVTSWCLECDYSLAGLTENRCPECGRVFDPADPDTMRTAQTPGKIARWLMQPPKWPSHVAAGVAAVVLLASTMAPGGYTPLTSISVAVWLVLLPGWLLRVIAATFILILYRRRDRPTLSDRIRWLVVPAVFLVSLGLVTTHIPLRGAFIISRPFMNSLAQSVMGNQSQAHSPQWVGVYHATDIESTPWGMMFTVSGNGHSSSGFAFIRTMPSDGLPQSKMKSLGRGWYSWEDDS